MTAESAVQQRAAVDQQQCCAGLCWAGEELRPTWEWLECLLCCALTRSLRQT